MDDERKKSISILLFIRHVGSPFRDVFQVSCGLSSKLIRVCNVHEKRIVKGVVLGDESPIVKLLCDFDLICGDIPVQFVLQSSLHLESLKLNLLQFTRFVRNLKNYEKENYYNFFHRSN